jgi:7-cyano-7-deazaguanine synthase in queuosine biosynthesis
MLRLNLGGRDANVSLQIDDISRRLVAEVPDVLTDLLEVATYVYCADQLISRGGEAMQALGAGWRRRLVFTIPVREPDLWNAPEVSESLARVLGFLSDETMRFIFLSSRSPSAGQSYFNFADQNGTSFAADEVALFSGGLDSFAGAVEALEQSTRQLVLVSHQASSKVAGHQRYLAQQLKARFPGRLLHVPIRITKSGMRTVETTQRTRSFLFTALATVVGHLLGRKKVQFYENGVVSINLPIASQVVGARATRSTHPHAMRNLEVFLSALLGETIEVQNPYVWKTKTEVASVIAQSKSRDLLPHTVSCSRVYEMTRQKTHCGRCSQCLDRRFATLAAGLENEDPEEMYEVDLLTGFRDRGPDRIMAENFVRHARELVRLSEIGFLGRFGGHFARVASGFPDLAADRVMENAIRLHQRHGQSVLSVLEYGLKKHALALAHGALPASCVLRLVGAIEGDSPIGDAAEADQPKGKEDARDLSRTSEIRLALDVIKMHVVIEGVAPIKGRGSFAVLQALVESHVEDRSDGLAPENHRFVATLQLTKSLGVSELTLRRRVERVRAAVRRRYEEHFGLPIPDDALIQTQRWRGYRLNPDVRVVRRDQLKRAADVTKPAENVTPR